MRIRSYNMPNRTLCDVLQEMRKCSNTGNFSYLPGLVEEMQMLGNRMEAGLWDQKDLETLREDINEAKEKLKKIQKEIKKASKKQSD